MPGEFTPMTPMAATQQQQQQPTGPVERPIGVTIIAILYIVVGAFILFAGVAILALGAIGRALAHSFIPWAGSGTIVAALAIIVASALFAVGILAVAGGIGNLQGSGWARVLVIILAALGLLNDLSGLFKGRAVGSGLLGALVQGFILWYYFRPNVKAYFAPGHGQSQQQQVVVRT